MRSPWRFLADLTSRRKSQQPLLPAPIPEAQTDEADDERASSVARVGSLDHPDTAEAAQPHEADHAAPPEPVAAVDDKAPAADARVSDPEPLTLAVDEPATEATSKRGDEAIVTNAGKKRAKRIQQRHVERPSSSGLRPDDVGEQQPATSARPAFLDEVLTLDVEIADLRAALAQRLKQQNAQLRRNA
ncbi:hypothetical protein HGP14_29745 [Rhizobium sp. P32RR-XVIII]|uniref:hypothetical protein n=1 Tax=Rhizobium sp. P32RR-XVIII TaxID=2726738 RepID=UPI0014578BB1|nr:hypothetical protein [Rhizobium sp. P32RR-XVIII]NLS07461.1 hypothetical protein [Rhizobium sp. P32RR-XVIII]